MVNTRTYALVELSQSAYDEIRTILLKADYDDQLIRRADGRELIDMDGLAVIARIAQPISPEDLDAAGDTNYVKREASDLGGLPTTSDDA